MKRCLTALISNNVNQNHNEILSHTHEDSYYKQTSVGKIVEKSEHLYIAGEKVK